MIKKLPLSSDDHVKILGVNQLARVLKLDKDVLITIAETATSSYNSFDRFKKTDKDGTERWRHIDNPALELKEVQDRITRVILKPLVKKLPPYLVGGMPGKSVLDNAYPHIGQQAIVEMDLEKCFENIGHRTIFSVWRALGFGRDVASILTKLTTLQNRLPQGSPASTILCNLALSDMAEAINNLAEKNKCQFTLYVDDVTVSGKKKDVLPIMASVMKLITKKHMKANGKKTEILSDSSSQAVTGVLVNKHQTISTVKYEAIRKEIIELGKSKDAINVRLIKSAWSKVHHVKYVDIKKGSKLETLAKEQLGKLKTYEGPRLKSVRTRPCKSIRNKH